MEEVRNRLVKCFEVVFPSLIKEQIPIASQRTVSVWDSVAAITLLNVIEEEFQIQMDFDLLPDLDSFESILAQLQTQATE